VTSIHRATYTIRQPPAKIMEGNFVAVLLLGALVGVWLTEDVAADTVPTKNASYFVNPKQFLTYVGQMDKIKSLGEEVHCKLHGTCTDKRRKIPKKISSLASKKSIASRPRGRMPDNHNNVLSPEAMMSPVAGGMLGANEYTQQPEDTVNAVKRSISTTTIREKKNSTFGEKRDHFIPLNADNPTKGNVVHNVSVHSNASVREEIPAKSPIALSNPTSRKSSLPFYRRTNFKVRPEASKIPSARDELSPVYVTLEERKEGKSMVVRPLQGAIETFLKDKINKGRSSLDAKVRRGEITNVTSRSNIKYASVPVIDLDPEGQISKLLKHAQESLLKRADVPSSDHKISKSNHIIPSTPRFESPYKKSNMGSSVEHVLPIPGRIQSPDDVKSEIEYPSSQEEISDRQGAREREENEEEEEEEYQYNRAQQNAQIRSDLQRPSDSFDFRSAAAESSSAHGMREHSMSYGNTRSGGPMVFEREVGFGPISVEAKTADAPPDSASED